MVLDDYSKMSIDDLGSSLLQRKADADKKAAKRSRKNERIQQALGVLMMGQGIMKNQYTKRVKELEDTHKFQIMDNESQAKEIAMHSAMTGKIGINWEDKGGSLDERLNSFESSSDYDAFAQEAKNYVDQKVKALDPVEYERLYGKSTYENIMRLGTREFAKTYLKSGEDNIPYYKKQEQLLRDILDSSEGKDMDRLELFNLGAGLKTSTLTQYDRKNYQRVLSEYRSQNNLVGGFKRVLNLFNDKQIKKGGPDLFSAMTDADLAGPLATDLSQALNLKGMTNALGVAIAEAKKSPTAWRDRAESKSNASLFKKIGNFEQGPLSQVAAMIEEGTYPSELQGTVTNIQKANIDEVFEHLSLPVNLGQKEDFVYDTTALSLRLQKDREFLKAVYLNTEGKKGKGRKSFGEFKDILSNENSRIQFAAMIAIDYGYKEAKGQWNFLKSDKAERYDSYGTLMGVYDSMALEPAVGTGIKVTDKGTVQYGNNYKKMTGAQKQEALEQEVMRIAESPFSPQKKRVLINALEDDINVVFGQDLKDFEQSFMDKKNKSQEVTQVPTKTEELLGQPAQNVQSVSMTQEPEEIEAKAVMVNSVLTEADENKPEEIKNNSLIPINIKQMVYDIFGGEGDVTEKDLSGNELTALKSIITPEVIRKGKLEYKDYQTTGEGDIYSDVGGEGHQGSNPISKSFKDPAYALKTTLGQARVYTNEDGDVIIEDRYNFNDADDEVTFDSFLNDLRAVKSDWKYFLPRKTAKYFGSKEGEGSKIMINLGKLDLGTFV
tara:strand:- start:3824 stop:6154 length:2331 start_codon:yes stop_codon:yes gene_type:complete